MQARKAGTQVNFDLNADNLFTALQAGYTWGENGDTPSHIQLLGWGSDSTEDHAEDFGWSLMYELHLNDNRTSLFARLSQSDGAQTDLEKMAVIGFGHSCRDDDLFGVGAGIGQSSVTGSEQGVLEVFYRYQSPFKIQITPDIQLHVGDGMDGDFTFVAGLLGHIDF